MNIKEETAVLGVEKHMNYQIEAKKDTVVMMPDTTQENGYQAEEMLEDGKIMAQLTPQEGPVANRQRTVQVSLVEEMLGNMQMEI